MTHDDDHIDDTPQGRGNLSRRRFLQTAVGGAAALYGSRALGGAEPAFAATSNVISLENRTTDPNTWSTAFRLAEGTYTGRFGGFASATSVNRGQSFTLALNDYGPQNPATATLEFYRLGYYGGKGSRKVRTVSNVPLNFQGNYPPNDRYGLRSLKAAWPATTTVQTSDLISGVYLIKVITRDGFQHHIPIIIRDDSRKRDLLVVMPTNTWQAYNNSTFKSLYNVGDVDNFKTVAGTDADGRSRATKVSFDRPWANQGDNDNWVLRTEYPLIYWLERQGYDIAYTDDVALHNTTAAQMSPSTTKTLVIAGHGEYWTSQMFTNVAYARNAGVNIASFSANAAYWQVRYEDNQRTMVCFKTVQGTTSLTEDQNEGVNDFGQGADARGGANDVLGADGRQGGSGANADKPSTATTTFRDPGKAAGSGAPDNSPAGAWPDGRGFEGLGRVGPNRPENQLFGVLYVGDNDQVSYPLQVPTGAGKGGEFSAHRAWRHTPIAGRGGTIGRDLVGWEWDAVPLATSGIYKTFADRQPDKQGHGPVQRLTATDVGALTPQANLQHLGFLPDEGSAYAYGNRGGLPNGQGAAVNAVTYRASSGALVFAAGTMQWSWGLGPHFDARGTLYSNVGPVDSTVAVIQQATYNVLADGGVKPATPEGIVLDSEPAAATVAAPPSSKAATAPVVATKDTSKPKVEVPSNARRVTKGGHARVRVTLPESQPADVVGTVTLVAEIPRPSASGKNKKKAKPKRVRLGSQSLRLTRGQTKILSFRMSKSAMKLFAGRKSLRVVAEVRVAKMNGNRATQDVAFRLLPRARPSKKRNRAGD